MGVSILGGTLSTLGAGGFMLFGELVVFYKFGIIMVATIFFSFNISMLFFGATMHAIGPQNGAGNIVCKCCKRQRPSKSEEKNEEAKQRDIEMFQMKIDRKITQEQTDEK